MLNRRQTAVIALLGSLVVGIAWLDRTTSQPPEQTVGNPSTKYSSKKAKEDCYLYEVWEWATHDAISVYTLFLAIFTGVIGVTAIVQIRYLRRATEHIPRVERAYVFLAAEFQHTRRPNTIPNTGDIVEVRFALKNHGKTPAIMRRINAEIRVVDQLPIAFREIASDMPPGLVISAGETTDFFTHRQLIPAADWAAFPRRTRLLLFLGVVYYTDVFGDPHETGFCLDWDGNGFGPSPTDALNYYK